MQRYGSVIGAKPDLEYHGTDIQADMAKMSADPNTQEWRKIMGPSPLESRAEGEGCEAVRVDASRGVFGRPDKQAFFVSRQGTLLEACRLAKFCGGGG